MRPNFRGSLERYGQQIKDWKEAQEQEDIGTMDQIDAAIDYELGSTARARVNSVESQRKVFEIQKRKQAIMEELRRRLRMIDKLGTREFIPYQERRRASREVAMFDGKLRALVNGRWQQLTLGELLTDGDWDIDYILDERTVPREIHKRFAIESAKRILQEMLDHQIIIDETTSQRTDEFKKEAYKAIEDENLSKAVEYRRHGAVAEVMFQNLLKKISIDTGADFEIIQADVYQDVHQKIDFIIRRKAHGRGVKIETTEKQETSATQEHIGIQLTLMQDPETLRRKERQLATAKKQMRDGKINDIILVTVQSVSIGRLLRGWTGKGRPAGGPDKLLDRPARTELLRSLLKDIFTPEEIETFAAQATEKGI